MAISNYTDLQSSVADWLARSDLTSQIVDCISLYEAHFNRMVRVRQMEDSVTLTLNGEVADLPSDFLEFRTVEAQANPRVTLSYATPNTLRFQYPTSYAGDGDLFTIEGGSMRFAPIPTASVQMLYYQKLPALADQADGRNWLIDQHPDAYLSGTLARVYLLAKDVQNAQFWMQTNEGIHQSLMGLDAEQRAPAAISVGVWSTP